MISGIDKCNLVKVCLQKFYFFYLFVSLNTTKITTVGPPQKKKIGPEMFSKSQIQLCQM